MTPRRDPDRLIHAFLMEGQTELPDPVYDAVRDRIEQTRQRAVIGPWRTPNMNNFLKIGLAAAAVVVIAVVAIKLLPGSPAPGGEPSASPSASEPSAEPSPAGGLPVGSSFVVADGRPSGIETGGLGMTVTIPAPGWNGERDGGILVKNDNADPPDGSGLIVWSGVDSLYVYGDPCHWSSTRPETPSTTVDEVVAALAAQASRNASAPVAIELDGYAGQAITLHVPDDAVLTQCDGGKFGSWSLGTSDLSPHRYAQGPGQIDEVWLLDLDVLDPGGPLVVIDWAYYDGTPQADVDELRAIVESATFGAP